MQFPSVRNRRHAKQVLCLVVGCLSSLSPVFSRNSETPVTFNDDGSWCWFQDKRVIEVGNKLIIGSIASGKHDPRRRGNVEVTSFDLTTGVKVRATLHEGRSEAERRLWYDDHSAPAFLVRPDGRLLAMFTQHDEPAKIHYRLSQSPGDATAWDPEQVFIPSPSSNITYSNTFLLTAEQQPRGRIYDFFRGLDDSYKPSFIFSDDWGATWKTGNVTIQVPGKFKQRPYVRYASNGRNEIHFIFTEGHPAEFDNSVYHAFYKAGQFYRSDGTLIGALSKGLESPSAATSIFKGDANNVAWVSDLQIDESGRPYAVYSVQKNSAHLSPGKGGMDCRYRYARWDGSRWIDQEIAYAGTRLYPGEDDYTGNIALDPHDARIAYISTNADPGTGKPLISHADHQRHWEIFRGNRGTDRWRWTPVTRDSTADNIRPLVPALRSGSAILWLRGRMSAYTNYDLEVVGIVNRH
jgi:hypothetical protein